MTEKSAEEKKSSYWRYDKQERMQIAKFHLDNYVYGNSDMPHTSTEYICAMSEVESWQIKRQIYFKRNSK